MPITASHVDQNVELQRTHGIPEGPPPSYSEAMALAHGSSVPIGQSLKSTSENLDTATHIPVVQAPPFILTVVTPPPQQISTDHSYDNIGFSNDQSETITNQPITATNDIDAKRYADVNGSAQSNDGCCNSSEASILGCLCCIDFCRCLLICCECAMLLSC